jgi:integrase/recombinase XerD
MATAASGFYSVRCRSILWLRHATARLVAYLESVGLETITIEAAMAWAQQPDADPTSTVWVSRMAVARGFARHLAGRDPRTEVPPVDLLPGRRHRRVPYIFAG